MTTVQLPWFDAEYLARLQHMKSDATANVAVLSARFRLDELLASPDLLEPPTAIVPRIAWRSRCTLFASAEKLGKSTFLAYATAQVSRGREVLGQRCSAGTVLVFGLEEFVGDIARRLLKFDADPTRVHIVTALPAQPATALAELRRHVDETGAVLVIVDTLIAYSSGGISDASASAQMQPIVQALTHYAHESGVALILVHHGRKSDGRYRDSSAIGAAVDVIIEVAPPATPPDSTHRIVRARGRVPTTNFEYRYESGRFELINSTDLHATAVDLAATLASVEADVVAIAKQIVSFVQANPGASQKRIRDSVTGGNTRIDRAIARLLASGAIVDQGTDSGHKYFLRDVGQPVFEVGLAPGPRPESFEGLAAGQPLMNEGCPVRATFGQGVGEPQARVAGRWDGGGSPYPSSPLGEDGLTLSGRSPDDGILRDPFGGTAYTEERLAQIRAQRAHKRNAERAASLLADLDAENDERRGLADGY